MRISLISISLNGRTTATTEEHAIDSVLASYLNTSWTLKTEEKIG